MTKVRKERIAILFTGGTISMRFDPALGGPVPVLSGQEILAQVPGLDQEFELIPVDVARLPGPHMTPALMLDLARRATEQMCDPNVDGVVITHGTDTLEESAYLCHLVAGGNKPVVFVGALRHSGELGWDGPSNLRAAVRVAAHPAAAGLGTLVVMHDQILAAADATKTHSESADTFQSRNFGPLGILDKDRILITRRPVLPQPIVADQLEERVEIIKLSAGSDGRLIQAALESGARGLIIEGLGRGNVPVASIGQVERAVKSGCPVVITSRCPRGRVLDTYAYEGSGKHLKRLGAILGGMLPSHKARIKLMVLLGAKASIDALRRSFEDEA